MLAPCRRDDMVRLLSELGYLDNTAHEKRRKKINRCIFKIRGSRHHNLIFCKIKIHFDTYFQV